MQDLTAGGAVFSEIRARAGHRIGQVRSRAEERYGRVKNRVDTRVGDVTGAWYERRDRKAAKQQQADLRRQRMTCSDRLTTTWQSQDWTGRDAISPSGRFRVVEEPTGRQKAFSREGIRWELAWSLLLGLAAVLGLILLIQISGIGNSSRTINRLSSKIEAIAGKNERMEAELAYMSEDVNVCTEAVKLNLVAAGGARTVRLTAPEYANTFLNAQPDRTAQPGDRLASNVGD